MQRDSSIRSGPKAGQCALCDAPFDGREGRSGFDWSFARNYAYLICRQCDQRAVSADGSAPEMNLDYDAGENPLFVEGRQCWRRYRFGGFVTMLDPYNCQSLEEFYQRVEADLKEWQRGG